MYSLIGFLIHSQLASQKQTDKDTYNRIRVMQVYFTPKYTRETRRNTNCDFAREGRPPGLVVPARRTEGIHRGGESEKRELECPPGRISDYLQGQKGRHRLRSLARTDSLEMKSWGARDWWKLYESKNDMGCVQEKPSQGKTRSGGRSVSIKGNKNYFEDNHLGGKAQDKAAMALASESNERHHRILPSLASAGNKFFWVSQGKIRSVGDKDSEEFERRWKKCFKDDFLFWRRRSRSTVSMREGRKGKRNGRSCLRCRSDGRRRIKRRGGSCLFPVILFFLSILLDFLFFLCLFPAWLSLYLLLPISLASFPLFLFLSSIS